MKGQRSEILKRVYNSHRDSVVEITQLSDDMAIITYDDRFWPPHPTMYGIAVKDGRAYGDGWQVSSHVYTKYDRAILGALEEKYDGLNSQFSSFAERMLGMDDEE